MYERILVPLDGSELAEGALPHAREIAKQAGSEVVLLQAVTPFAAMLGQAAATEAAAFVGPSTAAVAPIVTEGATALARQQHEGIVSSAREYLGRWANELSKEGIKARAEIAEGAPAQVILDYAQANGVGLIAMSTHGRSGLGRAVFGSVADAVLRNSGLPLLLIRSKG